LDAHAFPVGSRNDGRKGDGGEELGEEHGLIASNVKELSVSELDCERCLFVQDKNVPEECDSDEEYRRNLQAKTSVYLYERLAAESRYICSTVVA
jgi:hypothetical protein